MADLNNDGRLDLAVCTQEPSTVVVLLSTIEQVVELSGAGGTYVQDFDEALGPEGRHSRYGAARRLVCHRRRSGTTGDQRFVSAPRRPPPIHSTSVLNTRRTGHWRWAMRATTV